MRIIYLLLIGTMLSACNTQLSHVTFGTMTSLSIVDMDATPGIGGIAALSYDRVEASVGPTNQDGTAPSMFAFSDVTGSITRPRGHQVYATGTASECLLISDTATLEANCIGGAPVADAGRAPAAAISSSRFTGFVLPYSDTMLFGTSTTTGLKLGINNNLPSILIGHRRREISVIPLYENGNENVYPSALATIVNGIDVANQVDPGLDSAQVYATGRAAELLARLLGEQVRERVLASNGAN